MDENHKFFNNCRINKVDLDIFFDKIISKDCQLHIFQKIRYSFYIHLRNFVIMIEIIFVVLR